MATNEVATLGGGCFWCLEAVYDRMEGVVSVESGYMGGQVANPSYQDVCSGTTGHVEVTRVTFDPSAVTFREILEVFFSVHDPTTLNRQGNDVGTQYRSVIFYHGEEQKATAQAMIGELTAERDALIKLVDANQAQTFDVMRGVVICLSSISRVLKEGQGPLSVAAAVDQVVAEFQDGIDNSKIVTIRKI